MQVTGSKSLKSYRLSIRVFTDGFSLYTYNLSNGKLLEEESVAVNQEEEPHESLRKALERPRIMDYEYDEVEVMVCSSITRVPLDEFRREEYPSLYRLTFSKNRFRDDEIHYEILSGLEVVELYALEANVEKTILELYPDAKIHSIEGRYLENIAEREKNSSEELARYYAIIEQTQLFICTFQGGNLQFACSYFIESDADRLYFILYAWKTLGLKNEQNTCILKGASKNLLTDLHKYILHIETCA